MKRLLKIFLVFVIMTVSIISVSAAENKILITYFTYGENADFPAGIDASASASIQYFNNKITGNTGLLAYMIKNTTGGDILPILTENKYPENYNATVNQGRAENNAKVRPKLISHIENIDEYETIFLGFPNWWYDMPMAVYSFLDEYDLSGKTIIPFNTSGGSGFSNAINTIREAEPNAQVLEGLTVGANRAVSAESTVKNWLNRLGYAD